MTTVSTAFDPALLREALAQWPSGVVIATAADPAGMPRGFTATAFSALSMDPPLVLVCLGRAAECRTAFETSDAMALHLLRDDQQYLAERFATKGADKYDGLPTLDGIGGAPLLTGVLARIECRLERRIDAGDHTILIGRVQRCAAFPGRPLVYFARRFHDLHTGYNDSPGKADAHADDEHHDHS